MLTKVLVALDHSPAAERVFEQALTIAKSTNAQLMLLHVLSNEDPDSPEVPIHSAFDHYPLVLEQSVWDAYSKHWQNYEQSSLEVLQQLTDQATQVGVSTEFTQSSGTPEHLICDLAHSWNADVIVLGSRGHRGLRELFLGSISNYVTHHAPCSVWVVRPDQSARSQPSASQSGQTEAQVTPSVSQSA